MKVKYENGRLYLLPENRDEERFAKTLRRRMIDSNELMGWYGDAKFEGKETSAYVITWLPNRNPKNVGINQTKK